MHFKMISSRVFFSYFVCFAYCSHQTLSKPVQPSSDLEQPQGIFRPGKYGFAYTQASELSFASTGSSYIKVTGTLDEDHQRIVRATINLLAKPSTLPKADLMIHWAHNKTHTNLKPGQNVAFIFSENLKEAARMSQFGVPDFEQLKKNVQLPKFSDPYAPIPEGMSVGIFMMKEMAALDPDFMKFVMARGIFEKPSKSGLAILTLSEREDFKSTVDAVFIQARDEYYEDFLHKSVSNSNYNEDFLKKVNEYFMKNPVLGEEYKKLMDQVSEEDDIVTLKEGEVYGSAWDTCCE